MSQEVTIPGNLVNRWLKQTAYNRSTYIKACRECARTPTATAVAEILEYLENNPKQESKQQPNVENY